ncbi:MAG: hypothetical protein IT243_07275 [Bacteroidia bacterium]|nr:hypothetical protein [Bacteroidia bacterium]
MTIGQTYKYDQFGQQRLTDLPTCLPDRQARQPNASCFNFFAPAQNILNCEAITNTLKNNNAVSKFFGSPQTAHLQAALPVPPLREANPQSKLAKEPFFGL